MIISIPPHFAKIRKASTRRRRWFPPTHHNTEGNREDCPEKIIEIRLVSVIRCYKQNKDANPDEYKKSSDTNGKFFNHGCKKPFPSAGKGENMRTTFAACDLLYWLFDHFLVGLFGRGLLYFRRGTCNLFFHGRFAILCRFYKRPNLLVHIELNVI